MPPSAPCFSRSWPSLCTGTEVGSRGLWNIYLMGLVRAQRSASTWSGSLTKAISWVQGASYRAYYPRRYRHLSRYLLRRPGQEEMAGLGLNFAPPLRTGLHCHVPGLCRLSRSLSTRLFLLGYEPRVFWPCGVSLVMVGWYLGPAPHKYSPAHPGQRSADRDILLSARNKYD
jgi:hypothetical protein